MILTIAEYNSFGFKSSTELKAAVVQKAIDEAEMVLALHMIGDEALMALSTMDHDNAIMKGGVVDIPGGNSKVTGGYLRAAAYLTYSVLLRQNVNVTAFGTVQKRDENSDQVDAWSFGKQAESIGRQVLRDVAQVLGLQFETFGYYTQTI